MTFARVLYVLLLTTAAVSFAAIPLQINYQGTLTNPSGAALDTTVTMTFKLYNGSSGGATLLWTETHPGVVVTDGLFKRTLGATTALNDAILNNPEVWLGITVGSNTEMTPRQRMVAVGYAYRVGTLDGASGGVVQGDISLGRGQTRTGTWSFVAGDSNQVLGNYSTVNGRRNRTSADGTVIGGGSDNIIAGTGLLLDETGNFAFIGGGQFNRARGDFSVVIGGGGPNESDSNSASGHVATISGGTQNVASQAFTTIAGGQGNRATADGATVSGGHGNLASGGQDVVAGGSGNMSLAGFATVSGGQTNTASGEVATVSGGQSNVASGFGATVGGGTFNKARGTYSVVAGGGGSPEDSNSARSTGSAVGGGAHNRADGLYSVIPGGLNNFAANFSFASGRGANAAHSGSFVWADGTGTGLSTSANNQFLIRAQGGVGIGTNNPVAALEVRPDIRTDTLRIIDGILFSDGSLQTTAAAGGSQHFPDTLAWDATRTWVQSNGYLRGSNTVSSTGFAGGGGPHQALGGFSTIAGGEFSNASGNWSTIAGGQFNLAQEAYSAIGGGQSNQAIDSGAAVVAGQANIASGLNAFVGGGGFNRARGDFSVVAGGGGRQESDSNSALLYSVIGGGKMNYANTFSTVAGGVSNTASGTSATIGGGSNNKARGAFSVIAGGGSATATDSNSASGSWSMIPGGKANSATGDYALAAGRNARALHTGTFVWADSTNATFSSTTVNQFLIRAGGGVGINLNNPAEALEVNGDVKADTFRVDAGIRFPDGSLQTSAGGGQQYADTSSWDATRSWVKSMGYLQGNNNTISATGFVGGGDFNKARGSFATIGGGGGATAVDSNSAASAYAVVSGGTRNRARLYATVGGGYNNFADGDYSATCGGISNDASGTGSTIGGGNDNTASGVQATVAGGSSNIASSQNATIGGGDNNRASGQFSIVGGGFLCKARGDYSVVSGGGGAAASDSNSATGLYATISGGRGNQAANSGATVGGGEFNQAADISATIAGGSNNLAFNNRATVSGGGFNFARGANSTVCGGGGSLAADSNSASGDGAIVAGGKRNRAMGALSFAAGNTSRADHDGAWVWSDNSSATAFGTTAANQFRARAAGGTRFYTNAAATLGAELGPNQTAWTALCDSTMKVRYGTVDTKHVLDKLAQVPIETWSYKDDPNHVHHMGPMAQDFFAAFKLGDDNTRISTLDPDGVALASIQELAKQNEKLQSANEKLERELAELRARLDQIAPVKMSSAR